MASDPQTRLQAAAAALDAAKAACDDGCSDETVHAEHRAALEAAHAEFAVAGYLDAGVRVPADVNLGALPEPLQAFVLADLYAKQQDQPTAAQVSVTTTKAGQ